jgi:hypothetical protein
VDLNGDAVEDLTYRLTFDARDAAGKQRYVVRRIAGAEATDPHAVGKVVAQGTTGEEVTTPSGLRVWANKASDPFWIEPDVLHPVGHAIQDGTSVAANIGAWTPDKAKNLFAGHTIYAIVLEVPDQELLEGAGGNRRIGVWAVSTWRRMPVAGAPSTALACR